MSTAGRPRGGKPPAPSGGAGDKPRAPAGKTPSRSVARPAGKSAPGKSPSANFAPGKSAPGKSAPGKSAPGKSAFGRNAPDWSAPGKSAPGPAGKRPSGAARRNAPAPSAGSRRGLRDDYPTVQAFIAIGANLGDAQAAVRAAMDAIGTIERTVVTERSSLYRSEPVDATGPEFVNAVVAVRTGLTAEALLSELQLLEDKAGRERAFPNAPRTLDLDLLMHGNSITDDPKLTLPHPRMRERAFVLKPMAEIAPDKVPRAALARVSAQVCKRIV